MRRIVNHPARLVTMATCVMSALAASACRNAPPAAALCTPLPSTEVWVERRVAAPRPADTASASLSIALAPAADSVDRLPPRSVISVLIAGPLSAERPDTVRMITGPEPAGSLLWSSNEVRPGIYTGRLTTAGFVAGPRQFEVAPGERVDVQVTLHRTGGCANPSDSTSGRSSRG